jgi:hypothetical protein
MVRHGLPRLRANVSACLTKLNIPSLVLSSKRSQLVLSIGIIALASAVDIAVFCIAAGTLMGEPATLMALLQGAAIGTLAATCGATTEYSLFMRKLSRLPFVANFMRRLPLWCAITVAGASVMGADIRFYGTGVTFAVVMGTIFTLVVYLHRLVGGRTLLRLLIGIYNRPHEQEGGFSVRRYQRFDVYSRAAGLVEVKYTSTSATRSL